MFADSEAGGSHRVAAHGRKENVADYRPQTAWQKTGREYTVLHG